MFISPTVIRHGIIALQEEIVRLNALRDKYGDEWPSDFDPNDIFVFDAILQEFCTNKIHGYDERDCGNKPFRFFVELLCGYVINHAVELSQEDRSALFCLYSEAHIRQCLQYMECHSKSSPSFVESEISKLIYYISRFPMSAS